MFRNAYNIKLTLKEGKEKTARWKVILPSPALAFSMITSDMEARLKSAAARRVPLTMASVSGFLGLEKHLELSFMPETPTSNSENTGNA